RIVLHPKHAGLYLRTIAAAPAKWKTAAREQGEWTAKCSTGKPAAEGTPQPPRSSAMVARAPSPGRALFCVRGGLQSGADWLRGIFRTSAIRTRSANDLAPSFFMTLCR